MEIEEYFNRKREIIDRTLDILLPREDDIPCLLHKAMRYSIFAGGKRFRPILLMAVGETLGADENYLIEPACAIECIHTYSLIHDDLPCIDDDDYRRGKLTNHKVYGEAIAVLAGDALLTIAFKILSSSRISIEKYKIGIEIIKTISEAIGSYGMVGGQVLDISYEGKRVKEEEILELDLMKTARLIQASVEAGAIISEVDDKIKRLMSIYGKNIGIAFQIIDDLLDVRGSQEQLGKAVHKDELAKKATLYSLLGYESALQKAKNLVNEGIEKIKDIDRFNLLKKIAKYLLERVN